MLVTWGHILKISQVFNENGKDVTPKPLTTLKPTVLHEKLMSVSGQSQFTDVEHSAPIYRWDDDLFLPSDSVSLNALP